jgi:hypothetical protein
MRILVLVLALLAVGAGCHEADPDEEILPPPRKPCEGIYGPAVDACVQASGCAGIECLSVYDQCSANVKRGVLLDCCVANYATQEVWMECIDSLGTRP